MSKPVPVFSGVIDGEGKLRLDARKLFDAYLSRLKNTAVTLTIRKQTRAKSRSQVGYWWAVVIPILADEFGYAQYEHDAVHDAVMRLLRGLKPEPNPLQLRVSMADMSHDEVSTLIDDCRLWALDQGIVIPDPEKVAAA